MIAATMPHEHVAHFKPANPFPADIVAKAQVELDNLAALLEREGIRVYRPKQVDWVSSGGYTGSMPRDGLITVGTSLIEAPFAWKCRRNEIHLGYSEVLTELALGNNDAARICRAPVILGRDTLYDGISNDDHVEGNGARDEGAPYHAGWAINNSRPAFDAADFMRFGKTLIGQLSNVTNQKGVDYLRAMIPDGYTVEILHTNDPHAMHIDATLLPLRQGLLVYNPERVSEEELRRHAPFSADGWELHPYPFVPKKRESHRPPMYMCSPWLVLNALSIDEKRILVEEYDTEFADWLRKKFGMQPILLKQGMARDQDAREAFVLNHAQEREAAAECYDHISAAEETTGLAFGYIFHQLSRHPTAQKDLRQELQSLQTPFCFNPVNPSSNVLPNAEELQHLPFLNAVIKEGLRLFNHPQLDPRVTPPGRLSDVGWIKNLPPGVRVGAYPYLLNRSSDLYTDPYTWDPYRWLDEDTDHRPGKNRSIFAFSGGSRGCIGQHLAIELKY
ncbi:peroxisomal membrane protein pex16 [Purpureocillium lavendulum]|uniref:Glycine amidinotransferase, mitochondrial n=1 Tax=Purpureocillium lavendulum TaxID=1247861 RepID=A0AB34FND6_9HYPO|nr:peroxisomal membrane protein pex16 [Purpureocillium lavendulum]